VVISAVMAVVMVIAGFLFSAIVAQMVGLVGSSNNPVSGITISTILVSALLLLLGLGLKSPVGPISAILIGGVMSCAAAIGGNNLQNLKCGQLVGSTPWKQQVMQIFGVVVAACAMAPVLNLFNDAYTIGPGFPAVQASRMATVAFGVFEAGLPKTIIGIGAAIAVVVIVIDTLLERSGSRIRTPVMAFTVGVYLPFDLNVSIFLGGLISWLVSRTLDRANASAERRGEVGRSGLLAAAGLITGETLVVVALAVPIVLDWPIVVEALPKEAGDPTTHGRFEDFALPALLSVVVVLYVLALRKEDKLA
jgi:putative OPT family oligopeptide transporter